MNKNEFYIFTPGPVKMPRYVLEESSKQIPYFRTDAFSEMTLDCQELLLELVDAPLGSRVLFMASSGTGAMEACVMNMLNKDDKVGVVNGG